MKKHSLFKVILIVFGALVLINGGLAIAGEYVEDLSIFNMIPIGDTLINFTQSFYYFFDTAVYLLVLGAFYGVLKEIPAYKKLVDNFAGKLKNHSKLFVIVVTILFAVLTSLTGLTNALLVFVPFVAMVILALGYDKLVAISSTIVSMLVGFVGGIYVTFRDPNSYYGYSATTIEGLSSLDLYDNVWFKLALLVLGTALLVFFILRYMKSVQDKKVKYELNESNEVAVSEVKGDYKNIKTWPVIVVLSVILVVLILGYMPWNTLFGIEFFDELNSRVLEMTIGDFLLRTLIVAIIFGLIQLIIYLVSLICKKKYQFKILIPVSIGIVIIFVLEVLNFRNVWDFYGIKFMKNIVELFTGNKFLDFIVFSNFVTNNAYSFGNWASLGSYMSIIITLVLFTLILKFIYRVKFDEMLDNFMTGAKKMVPTVFLVMITYAILVCAYNYGFVSNITSLICDSKLGLNVLTGTFISGLGSLLHTDLYYTVAGVYTNMVAQVTDESLYSVYAMLFQSVYGIVSIIGPTSFLLIFALKYFDVPYTSWVKYIWRFVLMLLLLVILVLLVMTLI